MAEAWAQQVAFSILERIELGETGFPVLPARQPQLLSVSSNGSNWVKRPSVRVANSVSSLSVSSNGSNWVKQSVVTRSRNIYAFSILERIELGETRTSSAQMALLADFQYPRTDRIG